MYDSTHAFNLLGLQLAAHLAEVPTSLNLDKRSGCTVLYSTQCLDSHPITNIMSYTRKLENDIQASGSKFLLLYLTSCIVWYSRLNSQTQSLMSKENGGKKCVRCLSASGYFHCILSGRGKENHCQCKLQ